MNKITLIQEDNKHSDFIVDFPIKDISIDGKCIRNTQKLVRQLRLVIWLFGIVVMLAIIFNIDQSRMIIKQMNGEKEQNLLAEGDVVKFYKPLVGMLYKKQSQLVQLPSPETLILRTFPAGQYTITRVGYGGRVFCIEVGDHRYRFLNAHDSITKYE